MGPLSEDFYTTFTEDTSKLITDALSSAVDTACDHYEPESGSNATTFGVNVYNFAIHEFKKLAAQNPKRFKVKESGNLFRLYVGDFTIACHRVGDSDKEDIKYSFPNGQCSAHRMIDAQMFLPGMAPNLLGAKQFVLSHFANPDEGLCAVYLCLPKSSENKQIDEWAHTHKLWSVDRSNSVVSSPDLNNKPKPEEVPDILLHKKKKSRENSIDGNS